MDSQHHLLDIPSFSQWSKFQCLYNILILTEIHFFESIPFQWSVYSCINLEMITDALWNISISNRTYHLGTIKLFLVAFKYLVFCKKSNIVCQWLSPWTSKLIFNPYFSCLLDIFTWVPNRDLKVISLNRSPEFVFQNLSPCCLFHLNTTKYPADCLFAPSPTFGLSNDRFLLWSHILNLFRNHCMQPPAFALGISQVVTPT